MDSVAAVDSDSVGKQASAVQPAVAMQHESIEAGADLDRDPVAEQDAPQKPCVGAGAASDADPVTKRARIDSSPDTAGGEQHSLPATSGNNVGAPPKYLDDGTYVQAGDGWWAHRDGQWLFNVEERTYFHLPSGTLCVVPSDADKSSLAYLSNGSVPDADGGSTICRHCGTVTWFDAAKGFGFIRPEDSNTDVFVHKSQLRLQQDPDVQVSLESGDPVSFELGVGEDGRPCALEVSRPESTAADSPCQCDEDDVEDAASSSASSVELDLEEELRAGSFQEKGPGKDHCEDFVVDKLKLPISVLGETASCFFFGVFDGHGGHHCAEFAANHLAKNILSRLRDRAKTANDETALRTALISGFKQTEHNFLQQAKRLQDPSGSTACTMTVFGPDEQMRLRLFLANLGDSRAVLGLADGSAKRLTTDHKPSLAQERKRIEAEGGSVVNVNGTPRCVLPMKRRVSGVVGLAVSRSFGDKDFKKPDIVSAEPAITIHEVDWDADDLVILATDGVWDVVTDKDAVLLVQQSLRKGTSEAGAAEALVRRAQTRGSADDCSAIVVNFGWMKSGAQPGDKAACAAAGEAISEKAGGAPDGNPATAAQSKAVSASGEKEIGTAAAQMEKQVCTVPRQMQSEACSAAMQGEQETSTGAKQTDKEENEQPEGIEDDDETEDDEDDEEEEEEEELATGLEKRAVMTSNGGPQNASQPTARDDDDMFAARDDIFSPPFAPATRSAAANDDDMFASSVDLLDAPADPQTLRAGRGDDDMFVANDAMLSASTTATSVFTGLGMNAANVAGDSSQRKEAESGVGMGLFDDLGPTWEERAAAMAPASRPR